VAVSTLPHHFPQFSLRKTMTMTLTLTIYAGPALSLHHSWVGSRFEFGDLKKLINKK
jgi:hypothetical protein